MKNLEQIRAAAALKFWKVQEDASETTGKKGGDVIRGLASLVINNGLLATLAFATEKQGGHEKLAKEIGRFLEERGIIKPSGETVKDVTQSLTDADSLTLQRATAEALAYISYLKRFRKAGEESKGV